MSIVHGKKIYDCSQSKDEKKVQALGLLFNEQEIENTLKNEVYNRIYDIEMRNEQIQLLCDGLLDTGFKKEDILNIINQQEDFDIPEELINELEKNQNKNIKEEKNKKKENVNISDL